MLEPDLQLLGSCNYSELHGMKGIDAPEGKADDLPASCHPE